MKKTSKILDFPSPEARSTIEQGHLDSRTFFLQQGIKRAYQLVYIEKKYSEEEYKKLCT